MKKARRRLDRKIARLAEVDREIAAYDEFDRDHKYDLTPSVQRMMQQQRKSLVGEQQRLELQCHTSQRGKR